ncbi:MAG: DUF4127 family protein [Lachnospiraceae bacterium]|nr:DUF4127 family protein [Lachnospiraceae bacterium]
MKKLFTKILASFAFSIVYSSYAMASTIITAPLDSRPISTKYLSNLTALSGDSLIIAAENNLDYFASDNSVNRFADSEKVQADLLHLAKSNNNTDTTFIINTSSALTGGLVGSRCGDNYTNIEDGLGNLFNITSRYSNPTYYVHLVMPRNLPESRGNKIWPDDTNVKGLGYYYLQHNPNCEQTQIINERYSNVSPSQALMEWGYVEGKKTELGLDALSPWEKEYLEYFTQNYCSSEIYAKYTEKYVQPFKSTAEIFRNLVRWQKMGTVDEIIIGNDDSQLPSSVSYLYSNTDSSNWIQLEDGSPIKYSFARTYLKGSADSIYYYIDKAYGYGEKDLSLKGNSQKVNFLFGLDEIPQMIYARDLAKRQKLSADINVVNYINSETVESYDVLNPSQLLGNSLNYLNASKNKTQQKTDMYVFNYEGNVEEKTQSAINAMTQSLKSGKNVGLIELYTYDIINAGNNNLFKRLMQNSPNDEEISITQLSAFSAWNTNANAIGLGLAHAQVYSIAKESNASEKAFVEGQIRILGQHILEDGVYFGQVRNQLTREKYNPLKHTQANNKKSLNDALSANLLMEKFRETEYSVNGNNYAVDECSLVEYGFPWDRLFDCYIDVKATVSKN